MRSDSLESLGITLAGRYAIEREIGAGGMATVYLADDVKHARKVAIKVLRRDLISAHGADRFQREIRTAAGLNHPHILPLLDSGQAPASAQDEGLFYYVMPYVRGESLRQRLDREQQLPVDEAVRITTQVASALEHAHAQGIIHRDLKPENILLHEGSALITDFGIALAADAAPADRLTGTGMLVGTPAYVSPEQASGERTLDARSDLYSLGCVLYEMLAGEPPFTGPTVQATIAKRFIDSAPAIRRVRSTVPVAVDRALARALERSPADRFASAAEFAAALLRPDAPGARAPSVAVLPFLNLSTDPENEFFADGITEDVIAHLSKIRALKVISRTSVMPFKKREQSLKQISATLGVATIVEGSVRRAGDRVRIVAQLIDAESDEHLWVETYDRRLTDIFEIQTDVALQIAASLQAELSSAERSRIRQEPTSNVQAYQLYLQGRHWRNQYTDEGMRRAIGYFEQAIAVDPGFALAHTGVALVHAETPVGSPTSRPESTFALAKEAVARALALDPRLGEAHAVLALLKFVCDYDWTGAEQEFRLALELNPGSADIHDHYSWMLSALARWDEAIAMAKRAQELDPLAHLSDLASTLLRAGRVDEAIAEASRSIDFNPNYARSRGVLGWAYLLRGRADEAVLEIERAASLAPGDTMYLAQAAEVYALVGQTDQAREILTQLRELSRTRYVAPYHFAYVHTGLGEHDRAMDCLEQAFAEGAGAIYGIKGSYAFAPLRSHPRFTALLAKMNLA